MPHKTITISLGAYEALLREKSGKESFTDVILRLTAEERPKLSNFVGKWVGDSRELEKALSELDEMWRAWSKKIEGV